MQSVSIPYRSTKIYIYIYILSKELFFSRFDSNTFLSSPYFQAKSDLAARVNTTTLRSGILVYELHRILLPVSIRNFNRSHNRVSPKSIPFSILLLSFLPPLPPPPSVFTTESRTKLCKVCDWALSDSSALSTPQAAAPPSRAKFPSLKIV